MTKFRSSLLLSTAITLLAATGAMAAAGNHNKVYVAQNGIGNTANIDQTTVGGSPNTGNEFGTASNVALQLGNSNIIGSAQRGSDNRVGTVGGGFDQDGDDNYFDSSQLSDDNLVGEVTQTSITGGSASNSVTITQEIGAGGTNDGNTISSIQQDTAGFAANIAIVTQSGNSNEIDLIDQDNTAAATGSLLDNTITVALTGNENGSGGFDGGNFADLSGAASSELIQNGTGNTIILNVLGNENRFGVNQQGSANTLNALNIDGSENQLGVVQNSVGGVSNNLTVSTIKGDLNVIGADQAGGTNVGDIILNGPSSNSNLIRLSQDGGHDATITITSGDGNSLDTEQDGNGSLANITVTGGGNVLVTRQNNTSGGVLGNEVDITIIGSWNNVGTLSGDAGTIPNVTLSELVQTGDDNLITLNILTDSNLFGITQLGNDNEVDGTVDGGTGNQFAVLQNGNGNYAYFTQIGSNNNIGISQ